MEYLELLFQLMEYCFNCKKCAQELILKTVNIKNMTYNHISVKKVLQKKGVPKRFPQANSVTFYFLDPTISLLF